MRWMARQLWLLRHGEAEPHDVRSDDERRLTSRGEDQSRAAGRALAALEVTFQAVYTSPKVRARDTARLACEGLGCEALEHAPLRQGFVGHEPDFSQVVHDLTGAQIDLKKGGIAGIRIDGARGELIVLLRPREIDRIG